MFDYTAVRFVGENMLDSGEAFAAAESPVADIRVDASQFNFASPELSYPPAEVISAETLTPFTPLLPAEAEAGSPEESSAPILRPDFEEDPLTSLNSAADL